MRLRKGADVTSDIDIQYPSTPWRHVKGGVHPPKTSSGGWGSDVTASAVAGLRRLEARETGARDPDG